MTRALISILVLAAIATSSPAFARGERGSSGGKGSGGGKKISIGMTAQLGLIHPVNLELDGRFANLFGVGVAYGYIPVSYSGYNFSFTNYDLKLRWFTFGGAFFLGVALGRQSIALSTSMTIPVDGIGSIPVNVSASIDSYYVTPHFGWFKIFDIGLVLGFELGVQSNFGSSTNITATSSTGLAQTVLDAVQSTPEMQAQQTQLNTTVGQYLTYPLPYLTLLRLGWML